MKNLFLTQLSPFTKGLSLLLLAISLSIPGCKYEYFEVNKLSDEIRYEADWAIPLAHSQLDVEDILARFDESDIFEIDANGMLAVVYYSTLFSISGADLIPLADQTFNAPGAPLAPSEIITLQTVGNNVTRNPPPITYNFSPPNGEDLTSVTFSNGSLDFVLNNSIPHGGSITITIPEMKDLGANPFTVNFPFTASASGQTFSAPMTGYTMDLTKGGTTSNQIDVQLAMVYQGSGATAIITQTTDLSMTLAGMSFSLIRGDFKSQSIVSGPDQVKVKIFENSVEGNLYFDDPKMKFFFFNTYGAGVQVTVNQLEAYLPSTGATIPIVGLGTLLNVNPSPNPGVEQVDSFVIDKNNSNIQNCLDLSTTIINYDVSGIANPGTGPFNNFATDSSKLRLDVKLELPLDGRASNFLLRDTFPFEFPDTLDPKNYIHWVNIRMITENRFPCTGYAQVYFADSNYTIVDSLITSPADGFMASGVLDGNGRVIAATKRITDVLKSPADINSWIDNNVQYLIVTGRIETTNGGTTNIKIFKDYNLDIRLGMRVLTNLSPSDF